MQSPQAKLKDISRLLASWPSAAGEGDEQLRSYLLAVEDYHADDVTAAIDALIKGAAPGVNPSFLPPPAVVGSECNRQNHLRAKREYQERMLRPPLPPPPVERDDASKARVAAMVKQVVATIGTAPDDTPIERHRRIVARTNERFDKDPWFEVGDKDGDADAA